jgi:hypothetical protein
MISRGGVGCCRAGAGRGVVERGGGAENAKEAAARFGFYG